MSNDGSDALPSGSNGLAVHERLRLALGVAEEHQRIAIDLRKLRGNRGDVAAAWALLLGVCKWQWFCTFTFAPRHTTKHGGVHPEKADKAFRWWVAQLNDAIYGRNWKRGLGGVVWARGQEFHKDGRIHFHAVLCAADGDLNKLARRLTWMDFWREHFGFAQVEPVQNQGDVLEYLSKYVTKDGEVDFSKNFAQLFGWKSEAGALHRPASRSDRESDGEATNTASAARKLRFPLLDPESPPAARAMSAIDEEEMREAINQFFNEE